MNFDELMQKQIAENPEIISCADIPNEIEVIFKDYRTKTDGRGEDALYVNLWTRDGKRIVQKYTKSSYKQFYDAVQAAGGFAFLHDNFVTWVKSAMGQMKNARLLPAPKQAQPKQKK